MANVAHSTLTGVNLHEPKGADSASEGEVYVADGAGSGAWTAGALAFSAKLLHVRDYYASAGTSGQALTSGTWNVRTLNTTVTNEIAGAGLSSNTISLPAGTYFVTAWATIYVDGDLHASSRVAVDRVRLRNTTSNTTVLVGPSCRMSIGSPTTNVSWSGGGVRYLTGRFTIVGTTSLQLQHYLSSTFTVHNRAGLGIPGAGEGEVFADVQIWKLD